MPPADTINPTVSITSPSNGQTVSGTTTISATATVDVPVSSLNNGDNTISFWAATAQQHGIEILWPGPGAIVKYNTPQNP